MVTLRLNKRLELVLKDHEIEIKKLKQETQDYNILKSHSNELNHEIQVLQTQNLKSLQIESDYCL